MYVEKPPLVGSNPKTPITVPQKLVRIDLAVRKQRIPIHRAVNRIRFELVRNQLLESCTADSNQHSAVVGLQQVANSHSRHRIALCSTRVPSPNSRVGAGPESA